MTDHLPLFPLGTVLHPGLVLPLHVFEERYRALVRDLLALPEDQRRFGVIAIREGREVGAEGITALYDVGCTARLVHLTEHPDGRFDLVTCGSTLFRLEELHTGTAGTPYLAGDVSWLPDEVGDPAEAQIVSRSVRAAFADYVLALGEAGAGNVQVPELPTDPLVLSHLIAATVVVDLAEHQALLAEPDGRARLRRELRLLKRESVLLRTLHAMHSADLTRVPTNPN